MVLGISPLQGESGRAFHFESEIAPYFARHGCAAAECHGGATGRGGFKLSLFATNARADYEAITQHLGGRRIDYSDPKQSLILRKPTRKMRHKGGEVITAESSAYQALAAWIADGAPFARGERRELYKLRVMRKMESEGPRAIVEAYFRKNDGEGFVRNVSEMARFESTDPGVISIEEDGHFEIHGKGEAWIIARYGKLSTRIRIVEAFAEVEDKITDPPQSLSDFWRVRLDELGLKPGPEAGPHRFWRRLYFDLLGRPPAPHEIPDFAEGLSPRLIRETTEKLVQTEEFALQLTRHLWEWFEVPPPEDDLKHTRERQTRLREAIRTFASRDEDFLAFATSMIDQPERREFVQRFGDPRDRAEFIGRAHLGISIDCARCHNHPTDGWTQAEHLQFSALFADARPGGKGSGAEMAAGKFFLPGDGRPVEPAFLPIGSGTARVDPTRGSAGQLAEFLRDEGLDAFTRNTVNRVFEILVGQPLVEPSHLHQMLNSSQGRGLSALGKLFAGEGGYRLSYLVSKIVASAPYRLDSTPPKAESLSGDPQLRYLARREARTLSADEYLRAVTTVLGVPLKGIPSVDTPLAQQLQLLNSGILQGFLRTSGNQVEAIFDFESEAARQLEQLYFLILSRPPRLAERAEFVPLLQDAADGKLAGRDLAFALFASREFSSIR
jgi:hypothetical protein